jgi:PKHD-type hydroxylase
MIREDSARTLLFELDQAIQELTAERGHKDAINVRLTGFYHNLIRQWAEA